MHEPGVNGKRPEIPVYDSSRLGTLRGPRIPIGRNCRRCAILQVFLPATAEEGVVRHRLAVGGVGDQSQRSVTRSSADGWLPRELQIQGRSDHAGSCKSYPEAWEFDPVPLEGYSTYVHTSGAAMPVKRLNIEIPWQQYERLQREATARGTTISGVIRDLIAGLEKRAGKPGTRKLRDDSLYAMGGSFDGPASLAEKHDAYLYGKRR